MAGMSIAIADAIRRFWQQEVHLCLLMERLLGESVIE